MLDLGSDIQDNAELIRGEVGSYRDREFHMTLEHVPFDPNLTWGRPWLGPPFNNALELDFGHK